MEQHNCDAVRNLRGLEICVDWKCAKQEYRRKQDRY
jgi:hypothetical protein